MSDLLSPRYLSCREGLTVRQIKAHIKDWPDETSEGFPTRVVMVLIDPTKEDNGIVYVPMGEISELHINGEDGHMIVLPTRAVGKILHGNSDHPNTGAG